MFARLIDIALCPISSRMNLTNSPGKEMIPLIKKYWVIENLSGSLNKLINSMISDGHLEILFVEGKGVSVHFKDEIANLHSGVYLTGQLRGKGKLCLFPETKLHFIKLHPWACMLITDCPLNELTNRIVPLSDLNPFLNSKLRGFNPSAEIERIQEILTSDLLEGSTANRSLEILHGAALQLMASDGDFRLQKQQIMFDFNISDKTLENKFKQHVGLTPKQFSICIKMRKIVEKMIYEEYHLSLTSMALENGFFDQSHFIRTFKSIFETSPSQLQADHYFIPNSKEHFRYYTI